MEIEDLLNDSNMLDLDSLASTYTKPVRNKKELKSVIEYDLEGTFIASYASVKEAAVKTGVNYKTIQNICAGKFLHTRKDKGSLRIFLYRGDDVAKRLKEIGERKNDYKLLHPQASSAKEVCEYTLGGRFLFKYPTIKNAAEVNKTTITIINNCCKGKRLFLEKKDILVPK